MPQIDKAIVVNRSAIDAKYGAPGGAAVRQALQQLVVADSGRGLSSQIFEIDDAAQMAASGGAAVINATDQRGAKAAVDAICATHMPDYLLLIDGPDVIPHMRLNRIPGLTDSDSSIDSDLPYACSAAYSQDANDHTAVTRVVGRLPAAEGETDPRHLVSLLNHGIQHIAAKQDSFSSYFSISTDAWRQSTQLSLNAVFGNHGSLFVAPNDGHSSIDASLARLVHFINCHGGDADPCFYGEGGGKQPVAMRSSLVAPQVARGTVVAAECCYGAQLYNYGLMGSDLPICLNYLLRGAVAFVGATNIAYGPATSNGQADLMAQYFLQQVLAGASTGRALLQARQKFVLSQKMSNPINLKTLAQFVLYGDPSLSAVVDETPGKSTASDLMAEATSESAATDAASQRKARRVALASEGKAIASTASLPGTVIDAKSAAVDRFRKLATDRGYHGEFLVLSVTGGEGFQAEAKKMDRERQVAIALKEADGFMNAAGTRRIPSYTALVGHILGDGIFAVEQSESK